MHLLQAEEIMSGGGKRERERECREVGKDNTSHAHVPTGKGVKKKQESERGKKEREESRIINIAPFLSCAFMQKQKTLQCHR